MNVITQYSVFYARNIYVFQYITRYVTLNAVCVKRLRKLKVTTSPMMVQYVVNVGENVESFK